MKHTGSCGCGAVTIGLDTDPFLNYNCHCSHCRSFANSSFQSGAAAWRWNVKTTGMIHYDRTTALFGLFGMSRGRCANCREPVVEWCERFVWPFVMVVSKPLKLAPPNVNLFYDSGLKEGTKDLLTIRSDLGSLLYEVLIIVVVAIPSLPRSLYARLTRS